MVVKEGAPKPDIGNVEAFKQALLNAKTVAYIDPASGGSSGIYIDGLIEQARHRRRDQAESEAQARRASRRV